MDAKVEYRTDADLGGAPEGLDALIVAERLKACLLYTSDAADE